MPSEKRGRGRPKKSTATERIHVTLDPEMVQELDAIAKKTNRTRCDLIRAALEGKYGLGAEVVPDGVDDSAFA